MKYAENADYLVSSVIYLGSSTYWWGRTPKYMAEALCLDEARLTSVLVGYPGLFRQSKNLLKNGQVSFSLQARYAQYNSKKGEEPSSSDDIPPVSIDKIKLLLEFIQKMVEHEKTDARLRRTNGVAIGAALTSAAVAILIGAFSVVKDINKIPAPQVMLECAPKAAVKS